MAYYPTFQPYPYQDQLNQLRNQNPMPMQGFQMPMSRPDQNGLNWVQGEAGAKSWFVNPGATVLLMDSENQRFYVKSADMNGVPAMRTFQYTEVGQTSQTISQQTQFVTVEEFNGFKNDILNRLSDREKGESHE